MAGDKSSLIPDKIEPGRYQDLLKEDRRGEDCLPCRTIGAAAFVGLGAYTFISGHSQLDQQRAVILKSKSILGMRGRQAGINGIALGLVMMGMWRFFK